MEPANSELFTKVLFLLSVMMVSGAVSAYVFRNFFSCLTVLVGFVVSVIMIFVNPMLAETGSVPLMAIGSAIFGASVAFDVVGFAKAVAFTKGWNQKEAYKAVAFGLTGVAIATVVAVIIGVFAGFNLQGAQGVMFGLLILLLGISLVAIFVRFNQVIGLIITIGASIFWALYMIIDFNMVIEKIPTWTNAMQISMKIYLDMINLLLRLIELYLTVKKH